MKSILRHFVINTYCLYLTSKIAEGISFENGTKTLLIAGLFLTLVSFFAKPVINLLLLPINLVTFGVFRFLASAIVLYLVTLLVSDFKILRFYFAGFSSKWIDLPVLNFQGFWAFVFFSLILSLLSSFIYWLIK